MKILITGGTGFIAGHLFDFLKNAHTVVSLGSKELNLLDHAAVYDFIKRGRFDVVLHTATYDAAPKHSTKDKTKVLENNLRMFFNLVSCGNNFGKMIYFGSGAEFGRENWMPKMKETDFGKNVPTDQYGFSKYVMTKHAESSDNIFNLRLFAVFGKRDDWRVRFISNACCHAVLGMPIPIEQNKFFDFLYVDDLVKIVSWFIENKPRHHTYNVCTGKTADFKTVAEKIVEISGKRLDIAIKTGGPGKEYSGDNSRLLNELGNFKFTPLCSAVKDLYEWYDAHKETIALSRESL